MPDGWSRSSLDDHRAVSPYIAQRWALTRELLEVAPALSSSLRGAIAHGIANDDLSSAHDAVQLFLATNLVRASDLARHLAKRAPNLHHLLGRRLTVAAPSSSSAHDRPGSTRSRWWGSWILIGVIYALVRVISCEQRSSDHVPSTVPVRDEVMLTGLARAQLAHAIAGFRLALEHQDSALIATAREQLGALVDELRL